MKRTLKLWTAMPHPVWHQRRSKFTLSLQKPSWRNRLRPPGPSGLRIKQVTSGPDADSDSNLPGDPVTGTGVIVSHKLTLYFSKNLFYLGFVFFLNVINFGTFQRKRSNQRVITVVSMFVQYSMKGLCYLQREGKKIRQQRRTRRQKTKKEKVVTMMFFLSCLVQIVMKQFDAPSISTVQASWFLVCSSINVSSGRQRCALNEFSWRNRRCLNVSCYCGMLDFQSRLETWFFFFFSII